MAPLAYWVMRQTDTVAIDIITSYIKNCMICWNIIAQTVYAHFNWDITNNILSLSGSHMEFIAHKFEKNFSNKHYKIHKCQKNTGSDWYSLTAFISTPIINDRIVYHHHSNIETCIMVNRNSRLVECCTNSALHETYLVI